jgi:ribosomal protein S18 acetylase RimI-like enzyme
MTTGQEEIAVRPFNPQDAEACFKMRSEAFILEFSSELDPEAIAAAISAYMPSDYIAMSKDMIFFVAEIGDEPVGFCVVREVDEATAELCLLYVKRRHLRRGIGTRLLSHVESWLKDNYLKLTSVIALTVIPDYNQGFYQKCGYIAEGERAYSFQNKEVRAVRLRKKL